MFYFSKFTDNNNIFIDHSVLFGMYILWNKQNFKNMFHQAKSCTEKKHCITYGYFYVYIKKEINEKHQNSKLDEVCKDFYCVAHSFQQNSSMNILYKSLMSKTPKKYWDFP